MALGTEYFVSIFFGTFMLEDAALAASIGLLSAGKMSFGIAFLACFAGISLGDIGLYVIGYGAFRFGLEERIGFIKKYRLAFSEMRNSNFLTYSVVLSRIIPGTRLPTYLGAGFLGYSFVKFFALTILSVSVWVFVALLGGKSLHALFEGNWVLTVLVFLALLSFIKSVLPKLLDSWERKTLLYSWRKWMHFEFWPAWLFYLPIVPIYIYRSFMGKSFLLPFYANPQIFNGGLIGESKWDFLKHLRSEDLATLKSARLPGSLSPEDTKLAIEKSGFKFPFILKPDVGQRGYGVRIIKSSAELEEYLKLSSGGAVLAQTLSHYPREAGIFYYRRPSENIGTIFSITDKEFPFVVGDGKSPLGDLILSDSRARIIAPIYFARHKAKLSEILPKGLSYPLSECGNHCQGAIFKNGKYLISPALTEKMEAIARTIPDFYFGRFDVKYKSKEQLRKGLFFEIVEVNGAGSEATHIWDSETKIAEAYRVLFSQWKILFEIGAETKRQNRSRSKINIWLFLIESVRVMRRNDKLSISS